MMRLTTSGRFVEPRRGSLGRCYQPVLRVYDSAKYLAQSNLTIRLRSPVFGTDRKFNPLCTKITNGPELERVGHVGALSWDGYWGTLDVLPEDTLITATPPTRT